MEQIVINPFDKKSIDTAIKQLNEYQKQIKTKEKEFCMRLAEVGRAKAQEIFDQNYMTGFNDPVQVMVEETENGAKLVAVGQDVCFIEFGTGDLANGATVGDYTFTPGSWSSSELGAGMYSNFGYWYYNGEKFTGTPPANAMTYAIGEMDTRASEIAQDMKGGTI